MRQFMQKYGPNESLPPDVHVTSNEQICSPIELAICSSSCSSSTKRVTLGHNSKLPRNKYLIADHITLSTLLAPSSHCLAVTEVQEFHTHALKSGLHGNLSFNNALIGLYTNCGTLKNVVDLFERIPVKDRKQQLILSAAVEAAPANERQTTTSMTPPPAPAGENDATS
ncbi:hypothetical protein H5410_061676 [Solanum commersonii]|uniref:Pentatricopeptide repeat-containing protein n=1 Tax=Solanum commersonii TaxID=4109 RepID=A0A9J5WAC0_SOLCO|nr:hypothetical protein H5410_061676 [Solanum commersonii]